MKTVKISIDKMAEELASCIQAQPQEEQEFVAEILKALINYDKDIWTEVLKQTTIILSKRVCC